MNSNSGQGFLIIIIIAAIILLIYITRKFKRIVVPNVFLVTGAVKSGKTLLSVHLAIKTYKKNLRTFKIKKFLFTCIGLGFKCQYPPMLYSNIPLAKVKYNNLTLDIIFRKVRIPEKSVVLIDESSLLADSMLYSNQEINDALTIFYKLFAHFSHNGTCILDTQSLKDNHFSAKRCLGSYLYIYRRIKLPIITILYVREFVSLGDDDQIVNNVENDAELSTRKCIILNSTYKKYDSLCYSSFTDYKEIQVDYDAPVLRFDSDLKVYRIVTLQHFGELMNREMKKHLDDEKRIQADAEKEKESSNEENKTI